jgi:hypothetical protein
MAQSYSTCATALSVNKRVVYIKISAYGEFLE